LVDVVCSNIFVLVVKQKILVLKKEKNKIKTKEKEEEKRKKKGAVLCILFWFRWCVCDFLLCPGSYL
jgi:hypothetical protein